MYFLFGNSLVDKARSQKLSQLLYVHYTLIHLHIIVYYFKRTAAADITRRAVTRLFCMNGDLLYCILTLKKLELTYTVLIASMLLKYDAWQS
jgi:hypothetical protein